MVKAEQLQKIRKAKVALAMHDALGKVPREEDIEYTFRLLRLLYKAVRGIHSIKHQRHECGQLALF